MVEGKIAEDKIAEDKIIVEADLAFSELISRYLENTRHSTEIVTTLVEQGNFQALRSLGHNWLGTGASYGFEAITDIGRVVEQAALAQQSQTILVEVHELIDYLNRLQIVYTP